MLSRIDANQVLTREDYDRKLVPLQLSFQALAHELYVRRRALIVLFEGWDAAGKGGAIRRLTEQLDARGYEVSPIAAPEGEDRSHHYLYRFWRRLKPAEEKQVQIFDRSWYGRVLVERVEGFCTEEAWKRAYSRDQRFRAPVGFERYDPGKILAAHYPRGTVGALRSPPGQPVQVLEVERRRLAQPGQVDII